MSDQISDIDFVVTWCDENDEQWLARRAEAYSRQVSGDVSRLNTAARIRDWGFFKFWFRAVEVNAPWVRTIHLVVDHQVPEWLNTEHPKIHIVNHEELIDSKHLPTFNSSAIELNLYRIPNLAEKFVNFNDDMFLNKLVQPGDFFAGALPRDIGAFCPVRPEDFEHVVLNNVILLNKDFTVREVFKRNWQRFLFHVPIEIALRTLICLPYSNIMGVWNSHLPVAYDREFFQESIERYPEAVTRTLSHQFRQATDINEWLVRDYQICSGRFAPQSRNFGMLYSLGRDFPRASTDIIQSVHSLICLNDDDAVTDFEAKRERLLSLFEEKYPVRSSFER